MVIVGFIMEMSDEVKGSSVADPVSQVYSVNDQIRQITNVRLNGTNYYSWSHAIKVFLRAKRKVK